jgi:hypothetical protein
MIMKNVLATITGFIVASLVVYLIEQLGWNFFPLPDSIDPMDAESLKQNIDLIPKGSMIFVIIAHAIGAFSGMTLAGFISKKSLIPSYIVGGLMILATIVNLVMIPSPIWFIVLDLLGVILAFFLARNLVQSKFIKK